MGRVPAHWGVLGPLRRRTPDWTNEGVRLILRQAACDPAWVALEGAEGARIISNLVDLDVEGMDRLEVGLPVSLVWKDMGPELAIPRVRLA